MDLGVCVALILTQVSLVFGSEWLINVDECGVTKGCYRVPDKCRNPSHCLYFLTWQNTSNSNEIRFEYSAVFGSHSTPPWAGFGIADAPKMPGASVVDCIVGRMGNVSIQMSYNVESHHDNYPLNNTYLGLVRSSLEGGVVHSHIFCKFTRLRVINSSDPNSDRVKNLTMPYHLLFATGPTTAGGEKDIHDFIHNNNDPYASSMKIDFSNYSDFGGDTLKDSSVRAHATLMIFAWIVLASLGMFTSRYMKNQWNENGTVCGKPIWFQVHRFSMVFVLGLTFAAMLIVFAYNDWQFISPDLHRSVTSIHPTLGITVGVLLLVNLVIGNVRPDVYSPYRIYFWVLHAFFGIACHILAAATMFLGVMQHKAQMPDWTKWVIVGFAFWRILADVVMTSTRLRYTERPPDYFAIANNEADDAAVKVAAWRCAVMIVYSIGIVVLALVLIVAANVDM